MFMFFFVLTFFVPDLRKENANKNTNLWSIYAVCINTTKIMSRYLFTFKLQIAVAVLS